MGSATKKRLFVVFPPARGRMEVQEIQAESGDVVRRYALPPTIVRSAYFIPPKSLVVGGLARPEQSVAQPQTTLESFFLGAHLAVRLDYGPAGRTNGVTALALVKVSVPEPAGQWSF